jgi:DNA repair protein RecO (recombination protein O)
MQWTDDGIVLGVKRHGEANAIAELMTRAHGRHLGLVRGGFGSRLKPVLQAGNSVSATWRARLDEHLGNYSLEALQLRTAMVFAAAHAVFGVTHVASLVRLLPERDPHPALYDALENILNRLDDVAQLAALVARFELYLLAELGFGLDLEACVSTGGTHDLAYVSPKSGRAVSRAAGDPWHAKLLRLPQFLRDNAAVPTDADLADGYALTGYFFTRHVLEPRQMAFSDARPHFIAAIGRALPIVASPPLKNKKSTRLAPDRAFTFAATGLPAAADAFDAAATAERPATADPNGPAAAILNIFDQRIDLGGVAHSGAEPGGRRAIGDGEAKTEGENCRE